MDGFSLVVSGWGVLLALAVFVGGMGWRVAQWARTPASPVRLGLFPKPASRTGRLGKLALDTFVAPQSARIEPRMWAFAMAFHVAALAAFVGHLRLVREFTPLVSALGDEGMNTFAAWSGGIAGTVMLVAVGYWIARRTFGHYRQVSVPEDYLLLALLLVIVIMGDHMRFVGEIHAPVYREWFASVLALRPAFPAELATGSTKWSLNFHMLAVDLLLIYFPFSKLTHAIGAVATNLTRSSD